MANITDFVMYFEMTSTKNVIAGFWDDCRTKGVTKSNIDFQDDNGISIPRYITYFNSTSGSESLIAYVRVPVVDSIVNTPFKIVLDTNLSKTSSISALNIHDTSGLNITYPIGAKEAVQGNAIASPAKSIVLGTNVSYNSIDNGINYGSIKFTGIATDPCEVNILNNETSQNIHGLSFWFRIDSNASIFTLFDIRNSAVTDKLAANYAGYCLYYDSTENAIKRSSRAAGDSAGTWSSVNLTNNVDISINTWHKLTWQAGTFGSNDAKIYLDDLFLGDDDFNVPQMNSDYLMNLGSVDGQTIVSGVSQNGNIPNIEFTQIQIYTDSSIDLSKMMSVDDIKASINNMNDSENQIIEMGKQL